MPPLIKYFLRITVESREAVTRRFSEMKLFQTLLFNSQGNSSHAWSPVLVKLHVYGLLYYEKEFLHTRFHSYLIKLLSENIVCGRLLLNVVIKIFTFASVAVSSGSKVCLLQKETSNKIEKRGKSRKNILICSPDMPSSEIQFTLFFLLAALIYHESGLHWKIFKNFAFCFFSTSFMIKS